MHVHMCTYSAVPYTQYVQWNLSIAVTIGAEFFGCYRQVAALMR